MERGLIIVSYYLRTLDDILQVVEHFNSDVGYLHHKVLIVDNAAALPVGKLLGERSIEIIRGSNRVWEFSGWLEGLESVGWWAVTTTTLLNDSYLRNWNFTTASRGIVRSMYKAADSGFITGWLDNFSWFQRPRFSRRPNSRLMIIPNASKASIADSLRQAIELSQNLVDQGLPLFDKDEMARLQVWLASQSERWAPATIPSRLQRIFLEHHMFDRVPVSQLTLFPRTIVNSLLYSVLRRLFRERR